MEHFSYGIRQEDRVAGYLRRRGHATGYVPGSRGPFDLVTRKGRQVFFVQVKSIRATTERIDDIDHAFEAAMRRFSSADERRLRSEARAHRARAIVCLVNGDYCWFFTWTGAGEYRVTGHGWLPARPLRREH